MSVKYYMQKQIFGELDGVSSHQQDKKKTTRVALAGVDKRVSDT